MVTICEDRVIDRAEDKRELLTKLLPTEMPAIKSPMMTTTIDSSISVNAFFGDVFCIVIIDLWVRVRVERFIKTKNKILSSIL